MRANVSMRPFIYAVCVLATSGSSVHAATYYVNSVNGNDANTGQWTLLGGIKAWKSLAKVNAVATTGDTVKLARGSRWEETLKVKSGVTYEAYSSGSKPVIAGAKSLASLTWTKVAGTTNTYQANVQGFTSTAIGQLFLKNSNGSVLRLPRARHPNISVGTVAARTPTGDFGDNSRYFRILTSPAISNEFAYLTTQTGVIPAGKSVVGAQAFVRNNTYILLDYDVLGADGQTLRMAQRPMDLGCETPAACMDLRYEIRAGWGYWLENKDWMLDSPGEWFHDTTNNTLMVWMPNGSSPAAQPLTASVIDHGVIGTGVGTAIIRDIEVSETRSHAVALKGSTSAQISSVDINRAGGRGLSFTNATGGTIDNVLVQDSRQDGIWMGDFRYAVTQVSSNVNLMNSTVKRSGRDYRAQAGVMLGNGGTISNNKVEDSSYIGIHAFKNSVISRNAVINSCLDFDDCGAVYAISRGESGQTEGYYLNLTINDNIIVNGPGQIDGRADTGSSAKGIYMDDFANGVILKNNFVMGFDFGFQLHFARDVQVDGNKTFNNRVAELWLQENTISQAFNCAGKPGCDASNYLMDNSIFNNAFAAAEPSKLIWQNTGYASTSDFASFSNNRYASTSSKELVLDQLPGSEVAHQVLSSWQATGKDSNSTLYRTVKGYTPVSGAPNLVGESTFDNAGQGWNSYNGIRTLVVSGCRTAPCLAITPQSGAAIESGKRVFLINTANAFTVTPGKEYILTFEARSTNAGDSGFGVFRKMEANYNELSARGQFQLDTTWQRYYRILTAEQLAAGTTARLDFEFLANGTIFVDNITLIEAQSIGGRGAMAALYNPQSSTQSVGCPTTNTQQCAQYIDIQTGNPIKFPKSLPAKSAIIAVWRDSPWQDADKDSVPDTVDACPNTPAGRSTDATGCSI